MSIKGRGRYPLVLRFNTSILRTKICICGKNQNLMYAMCNYVFGTDTLKIWDGGDWKVSNKIKVSTINGFVKKNLKVWDGEKWVIVNAN